MTQRNPSTEFLLLTTQRTTEGTGVHFDREHDTLWLTPKRMAEWLGSSEDTIKEHLSELIAANELDAQSVMKEFVCATSDGTTCLSPHYALDALIAVSFRVQSQQATDFRQWATKVLRSMVVKGYVLDSERLKNGALFDDAYFDELIEAIREIRASERLFYQKVTDLFATASDYDPRSRTAQRFFASVQDKLHYAVHRHTAAELMVERADAQKPHMGLSTWKNATSGGKILPSDVLLANNYLTQAERDTLNRLVSMYLDVAELRAQKRIPMTMQDWEVQLERFLVFNEEDVLIGQGAVSTEEAQAHARAQFQAFRVEQDRQYVSDFDALLAHCDGQTNEKKIKNTQD